MRRTAAFTRAFERNHVGSGAAAGSQDSNGGRGGGVGNEGLSGRRASGSDLVVPGAAEEAPR